MHHLHIYSARASICRQKLPSFEHCCGVNSAFCIAHLVVRWLLPGLYIKYHKEFRVKIHVLICFQIHFNKANQFGWFVVIATQFVTKCFVSVNAVRAFDIIIYFLPVSMRGDYPYSYPRSTNVSPREFMRIARARIDAVQLKFIAHFACEAMRLDGGSI